MKKSFHQVILSVVMTLLLSGSGMTAETVSRSAYDRYVAAYQAYQDAITQNLAESLIKQKLEEYQEAQREYDRELKGDFGTQPVSSSTDPTTAVSSGNTADPLAAATTDPTGNAPVQQKDPYAGLSPALKGILQNLWGEKSRKTPDAAMAQLQQFIKTAQGYEGQRAQYELARAYELLKNDLPKAQQVLQVLAAKGGPNQFSQLATERLKFLQATVQHNQWKDKLYTTEKAVSAQYKAYRETSWFAFPLKIGRFASYFGKVWKQDNEQEDFKKFQLAYENLAARFAPAPDLVYDTFKVPVGSEDPQGNVRLVYSNSDSWYMRWKLLNEARSSIDIQYFIVDGDIFGMSLQGLLLRKAREGVKIRFMMDARGTKGFTRKLMGQDYIQELVQYPNVEVKVFNPVHQNFLTLAADFRRIMASNHDKIIVVDNEYSIVGGRNVSKDYFVDNVDHATAYLDCDVVIQSSEVAQALALAFDEEFAEHKQLNITKDLWGNIDIMSKEMEAAFQAMETFINGRGLFKTAADKRTQKALNTFNTELAQYKTLTNYGSFDLMKGAHPSAIKIIDKHSLHGFRNDITDQVVRFIDGSKFEIIIQNPYVVLTERAEAALKRASRRGVRIIFHTNSPFSTDSLATQAMFYADWKRILKEIPTAQIWVFTGQRKLHGKTFIFDRKVSIVGTYNMDYLSEEVNSEVVAAMKSDSFVTEHRTNILDVIRTCKQYQISIDEKGEAQSKFGPDDLPGKNMWLMKTLSKFGFLKPLI